MICSLKPILIKKIVYLISRKIDLVKIEKDEFEIPECILKLEVYNDLSKLDEVKNLYDQLEFGSEKWYISKFTTLIHLEEAATRKRLANSNLTEVEIYPKSRQEFAINVITISGCFFEYFEKFISGNFYILDK